MEKSINNYWGVEKTSQETYDDLTFKPIPGYQGENKCIKSENIFGLTYENARKAANELTNQINKDKSDQLMKSSKINK